MGLGMGLSALRPRGSAILVTTVFRHNSSFVLVQDGMILRPALGEATCVLPALVMEVRRVFPRAFLLFD